MHPRLALPALLLAAAIGVAGAAPAARAQAETPAAAPAAPSATPPAGDAPAATAQQRHHALSLVGEPKYGPDFKHFDWVNPDAPKGGTLRGFAEGSFDSLNPFSVKGDAGRRPRPHLRFAAWPPSPDEPSTEYGADRGMGLLSRRTIRR